jgi:hypothetical protein
VHSCQASFIGKCGRGMQYQHQLCTSYINSTYLELRDKSVSVRQRLEVDTYEKVVGCEVSMRDAIHEAVVLIKHGTLVPSTL